MEQAIRPDPVDLRIIGWNEETEKITLKASDCEPVQPVESIIELFGYQLETIGKTLEGEGFSDTCFSTAVGVDGIARMNGRGSSVRRSSDLISYGKDGKDAPETGVHVRTRSSKGEKFQTGNVLGHPVDVEGATTDCLQYHVPILEYDNNEYRDAVRIHCFNGLWKVITTSINGDGETVMEFEVGQGEQVLVGQDGEIIAMFSEATGKHVIASLDFPQNGCDCDINSTTPANLPDFLLALMAVRLMSKRVFRKSR